VRHPRDAATAIPQRWTASGCRISSTHVVEGVGPASLNCQCEGGWRTTAPAGVVSSRASPALLARSRPAAAREARSGGSIADSFPGPCAAPPAADRTRCARSPQAAGADASCACSRPPASVADALVRTNSVVIAQTGCYRARASPRGCATVPHQFPVDHHSRAATILCIASVWVVLSLCRYTYACGDADADCVLTRHSLWASHDRWLRAR